MTTLNSHIPRGASKAPRTRLFARAATGVILLLLAIYAAPVYAGVTTLGGRNLRSVSFQTQDAQVSAACIGVACTRPKIFDILSLVCPVAIGQTCTYDIHLESQVQVTAQDAGRFRFLVDGIAPVPGPTDSDGAFTWLDNDPDSNVLSHFEVKSFTVAARVSNTTASQTHQIQVQISCSDTSADGACAARSGFSVLEVKIHTP